MNRSTPVASGIMQISALARCTSFLCSLLIHALIALLAWLWWYPSEPTKPSPQSKTYASEPTEPYHYQQAPIIFTPNVEFKQTSPPYTAVPPESSSATIPNERPPTQIATAAPSTTLSAPMNPSRQQSKPTTHLNATRTSKRHINFADVAKGFLSRSPFINRDDITEETPITHANQIKFERFAERVLSAIHNAFKLLKQSLMLPFAPSGTTHIAVTLASDGMLEHARIARASNNPYFDQFLLNVVKQGGSMFPPLPSGLEQQTEHLLIIATVTFTPSGGTALSFSLTQDAHKP